MVDKSAFLLNLSVLYRNTQKYFDKVLVPYEIGSGQLIFLLCINENEGLTMQELTNMTEVDKGTTTKSVQRLIDQGNLESALRQLNRADAQDEEWYVLAGKILMGLRRYEEAEASFRRALKYSPDSREYHALALDASIAARDSKKINVRIQNWFKDSFGKR
jgi:DNA-binding MarR family transcriptional regulator